MQTVCTKQIAHFTLQAVLEVERNLK